MSDDEDGSNGEEEFNVEDEEDEYHNEENAVEKRFTKYKENSNKMGLKFGDKLPDNLMEELEEVFHDANDQFMIHNNTGIINIAVDSISLNNTSAKKEVSP